jgi:hypothetical protein
MKKFLLFAAVAASLAACTSDDTTVADDRVEAQITAGVGSGTRASDTTWGANDVIGVYVTGVEGTSAGATSTMASLYTNAKYTIASGANTQSASFAADAGNKIYFQDSNETVTFAAYYPYQADASAITIDTRSNNTAAAQPDIDLLYASGAKASKAAPAVSFTGDNEFRHVMSRLALTIKLGTGFSSESLPADATVKLSGLVHEGTFSLTGENAGKALPKADAEAVADWDVTASYGSLILLPQDLSEAPLTVAITVDGQTFSNSTNICPNMKPGTSYSYGITVNMSGLAITGSTISKWDPVEGDDGEATL